MKKNLRLHRVDFTKYLGTAEEIRTNKLPFTGDQLTVMTAGSSAIYLALLKPTFREMKAEYVANAEENRLRFPTTPQKTMWKGEWG